MVILIWGSTKGINTFHKTSNEMSSTSNIYNHSQISLECVNLFTLRIRIYSQKISKWFKKSLYTLKVNGKRDHVHIKLD